MKKNLYFRTVLRRKNLFTESLFIWVQLVASYPRLMLEVLIRKNFGQRYFNLASAITIAAILILFPLLANSVSSFPFGGHYRTSMDDAAFWSTYITWYLFTFLYMFSAYQRWQEVRRNPSTFDFNQFSLYAGIIDNRFFDVRIGGKLPDYRRIEIFYEPALFFGAGVLLWLVGQSVGILLIVSAFLYSISYASAYKKGDNFVMDKIDEMILNEEMGNAFIHDKDPERTRGVRFYMRKPKEYDLRRK